MADTTFRTMLPPLKAIDNRDGTYSVAVSIRDEVGDSFVLPFEYFGFEKGTSRRGMVLWSHITQELIIAGRTIDGKTAIYVTRDYFNFTKVWEDTDDGMPLGGFVTADGTVIVGVYLDVAIGTNYGRIVYSSTPSVSSSWAFTDVPFRPWHFTQRKSVIYAGAYGGTVRCAIYSSGDEGATWALVVNLEPAFTDWHVHSLHYNPIMDTFLITCGDLDWNVLEANSDFSVITSRLTGFSYIGIEHVRRSSTTGWWVLMGEAGTGEGHVLFLSHNFSETMRVITWESVWGTGLSFSHGSDLLFFGGMLIGICGGVGWLMISPDLVHWRRILDIGGGGLGWLWPGKDHLWAASDKAFFGFDLSYLAQAAEPMSLRVELHNNVSLKIAADNASDGHPVFGYGTRTVTIEATKVGTPGNLSVWVEQTGYATGGGWQIVGSAVTFTATGTNIINPSGCQIFIRTVGKPATADNDNYWRLTTVLQADPR